jgi:hypothetical protein
MQQKLIGCSAVAVLEAQRRLQKGGSRAAAARQWQQQWQWWRQHASG